MIIFDRKSKDLEIPKSLGNVAVDVASGTTDAITRDELRETVSRANERTLAAAERYAAEEARGAVSVANAYTDGVVAESSAATLDQAKDYTDSAITLTDDVFYLSGYTNYWDVGVQAVNALFNKVDAMGGQQTTTLTFQKLRVFIACDGAGAKYEFHPIYMDKNNKKIFLYWTGLTYADILGGRNLIRARYLTLTWNTPISQSDMVEVVVNGS